MARESKVVADLRVKKLGILQKHYASFNTFLERVMTHMGFDTTEMQHDIAAYLQHGPQYLMVQAQRGEAKSTITACFAVWCLVKNPKFRVLIVSAGGKQANEIATLVQRIILTMDELECIRPDANNGDRTSVEAFDVHYTLKGIDKSPSVACIGITGNLPGKRADLLIADDVESPKNSMTAPAREMLLTLSLEFSAICSTGRIIYLGTPQTGESIYNSLPGRGYTVRIWPGRYPSPKELPNYGEFLAPFIRDRLNLDPALAFGGGITGDKGKVTDPHLLSEEDHQKKLLDRGESSYQLNYMLNTRLMDAQRFPLKLDQIVSMSGLSRTGRFPLSLTRGFGMAGQKQYQSSGFGFSMALPHSVSDETDVLQGVHLHVDPAGGGKNGDETAWACTGFLNGNVYVLGIGGVTGGYDLTTLTELSEIVARFNPQTLSVEKNMGHGGFIAAWLPTLRKHWKGNIEEPFVSGQKEARIIGTLEPIMGRGSLIFCESIVEDDHADTEQYAGARKIYSVFHQIAKLTRTRGCLTHDDRIDALEGAVRPWTKYLMVDQEQREKDQEAEKLKAFMADPFGRKRYQNHTGRTGSVLNRYRR